MSNKLEEMKKKLLSNRPATTTLQEKPENHSKPPQVKEQSAPKAPQVQQALCDPPPQTSDKNIQSIQKVNSSSPSKQVKVAENAQPLLQDKPLQDKKESELVQVCQQEELQSGQIKRQEQPLAKKNEDPICNLELVDKNPFLSCSVDEEVRGSLNNISGQDQKAILNTQRDSKQKKKQQKIVLKQLELIKESIKNLKSSIKGLQKLENMIAADPSIKNKVKHFLQQLAQGVSIPISE